jgi:hypothetical protein
MGREIVSEYKFDEKRTAAETLALAAASRAQLEASEPLGQERRLVVIDTWARALGDAWQDFDKTTSRRAGAEINAANQILKEGREREMFWGALQASVIAGSEAENGDLFVALATMHYLENFAEWGYQATVAAGIGPSTLGNSFQWVPAASIPDARKFVEAWVNGAPEADRSRVYAEIAGEVERVHKSVSRWNVGLREATMAVAKEWAKRGSAAPRTGPE